MREGYDCKGVKYIERPLSGYIKDITGQKFNKMTAKFPVYRPKVKTKKTTTYWLCQCDCGNEKIAEGAKLRNNTVKSCGCLDKEKTREAIFIDLTGQSFGEWTVIKEDEQPHDKPNGKPIVYWICQCVCGEIRSVSGINLKSGASTSCGCRKSKGEQKIKQLLIKNNISFITQKTFSTCFYLDKAHPSKFDFYINNEFLLEFDGLQHYQTLGSWNDEEALKGRQARDQYKNQWCKENNIPLKRIPYWELDNITIENIMDDTFLIT